MAWPERLLAIHQNLMATRRIDRLCPSCMTERTDFEHANGGHLERCPNCGSNMTPFPRVPVYARCGCPVNGVPDNRMVLIGDTCATCDWQFRPICPRCDARGHSGARSAWDWDCSICKYRWGELPDDRRLWAGG